jgi:hypothetical protein
VSEEPFPVDARELVGLEDTAAVCLEAVEHLERGSQFLARCSHMTLSADK